MNLTDEQWEYLKPYFEEYSPARRCVGRPRRSDRRVLDGILWVMRTEASWRDLPGRYPSYKTCHRRFLDWQRSGFFGVIVWALAVDLAERGGIDVLHGGVGARPAGALGKSPWQARTLAVLRSRVVADALRVAQVEVLDLGAESGFGVQS